jgi:hypothetical protein
MSSYKTELLRRSMPFLSKIPHPFDTDLLLTLDIFEEVKVQRIDQRLLRSKTDGENGPMGGVVWRKTYYFVKGDNVTQISGLVGDTLFDKSVDPDCILEYNEYDWDRDKRVLLVYLPKQSVAEHHKQRIDEVAAELKKEIDALTSPS